MKPVLKIKKKSIIFCTKIHKARKTELLLTLNFVCLVFFSSIAHCPFFTIINERNIWGQRHLLFEVLKLSFNFVTIDGVLIKMIT